MNSVACSNHRITGQGYPDFSNDPFASTIDENRCRAVGAGRRCQLYRADGGKHAHAWQEPVDVGTYRRGSGRVRRSHIIRWADGMQPREVPSGAGLTWCCRYRA